MSDKVKEEVHVGPWRPLTLQAGLCSFQHPFTHFPDGTTSPRTQQAEASLLRGSRPDTTNSHVAILTFPEFMKAVETFPPRVTSTIQGGVRFR